MKFKFFRDGVEVEEDFFIESGDFSCWEYGHDSALVECEDVVARVCTGVDDINGREMFLGDEFIDGDGEKGTIGLNPIWNGCVFRLQVIEHGIAVVEDDKFDKLVKLVGREKALVIKEMYDEEV